jgi:outer membrane lipoprotein-sorting protein
MRKEWLCSLLLLLPMMTGCLSHTLTLPQPELAGPVVNADVLQLVETINQRYDQISSLTATVEFTASVGGEDSGQRTEYASCMGYILFRKPRMLRVLVLLPVLHTHAMDLVSNGTSFTLLIPPKNRAIEGSDTITAPVGDPVEKMRPNVFVDTMLIHSIAPDEIVSVIHTSVATEDIRTKRLVELPEYDLTVLDREPLTEPAVLAQVVKPRRVIRISQVNLLPTGQDIYNANGEIETQVLYGPYQDFGGISFPSTIDINRLLDEYRIRLAVKKLTVNRPLADDKFELRVPESVPVEKLQ